MILAGFIALTFPPCFSRISTGLDGSWSIALNEVASRHLVWGRDVAFTYGPLGFALNPLDFGSNMAQASFFRVGLHVLWWTSVGILLFRIRGNGSALLFAAASVYSGVPYGPGWNVNAQLTSVIVLTAVGYLVLACLDRRVLWALPAAAVSAAAVLAKFNLGVACTGALALWAALQLIRDRSPRMLGKMGLVALTYGSVMVALFQAYGGPITALGDFLRSSQEFAAGYSSQMSTAGPLPELVVLSAVLVAAVIAVAAAVALRARSASALTLLLFPFWVLFKAAIVRHDTSHVATSLPAMIGLTAFVLPFCGGGWRSWLSQAVVSLAVLGGAWWFPLQASTIVKAGVRAYLGLYRYRQTMAGIRTLDAKIEAKLRLPASILEEIGPSTVDVYPSDICVATANGLNWRPRFALQSYAAYTPGLDRRCAEDYRGESAPQYILYSHQATDFQHPCVVDSQTWIEIYRWYDIAGGTADLLLLKRRAAPRFVEADEMGIRSITFGERWDVPQGVKGPLFLRAKFRLNPAGVLTALFFKVYPPNIRIEYGDGSVAEHRLVWQNVRSGFLVSDLPRDIGGVRRLFEHGEADPVRAVTFVGNDGWFVPNFRVAWSQGRSFPALSRK